MRMYVVFMWPDLHIQLKLQLERAKFKYAHMQAVHWQHRKANLLKSMLDSDSDIICLQVQFFRILASLRV